MTGDCFCICWEDVAFKVRFGGWITLNCAFGLVERESKRERKTKRANTQSIAKREKLLWGYNTRLLIAQQPVNKIMLSHLWLILGRNAAYYSCKANTLARISLSTKKNQQQTVFLQCKTSSQQGLARPLRLKTVAKVGKTQTFQKQLNES